MKYNAISIFVTALACATLPVSAMAGQYTFECKAEGAQYGTGGFVVQDSPSDYAPIPVEFCGIRVFLSQRGYDEFQRHCVNGHGYLKGPDPSQERVCQF